MKRSDEARHIEAHLDRHIDTLAPAFAAADDEFAFVSNLFDQLDISRRAEHIAYIEGRFDHHNAKAAPTPAPVTFTVDQQPTYFDVTIKRLGATLGERRVYKPSEPAAAGWMDRGQAKTAEEATQVVIAWAFSH